MGNNLFGQYEFRETLIHKLDPRIKILSIVFLSIFLFLIKEYTFLAVMSCFVLLLILISKIKIKNILKNIKPFLFFFIFILLMYFLFSKEEFNQGIIVIWRFILLIVLSSILTFSTSISQLVFALEKLFTPLKMFSISPRNIAVMTSATIRFIPLLFLEANKIKDAQSSRGASPKKIKYIMGLINPLLRKTFNKASNLADAMESRCYRDYGYSHFKELKIGIADYASALFVIVFVGGLLWMQI